MDNLKLNQTQIIKAHLLEGKPITTWQAIQLYRITSFTTRISELRKLGLQIEQKRIHSKGKYWNVYWLNSDYIETYISKESNYE